MAAYYLYQMNYFELYDLPLRPVADKTYVAKQYLALQRKYHPDFFADANEYEKENMLQVSADVNKAYKVFMDEDATIAYFLQHKGLLTSDEKYALPPDFLMEMMEINEDMETVSVNETAGKLADFQKDVYSEIAGLLTRDADSLAPAELEQLKAYYYKKKYMARIAERLENNEDPAKN